MVNPPGWVAEWQLSHQVIPKLPVRFRPQSSHTPNPPYLSSTIRKYAAVTNSTIRPNKIRLAPLGHLQGPQHREIPCRGDGRREGTQPANASNVSLEVSIAWPLNEIEKSPSRCRPWSFLTRMSPSTLVKSLSMPLTILST